MRTKTLSTAPGGAAVSTPKTSLLERFNAAYKHSWELKESGQPYKTVRAASDVALGYWRDLKTQIVKQALVGGRCSCAHCPDRAEYQIIRPKAGTLIRNNFKGTKLYCQRHAANFARRVELELPAQPGTKSAHPDFKVNR